MKRNALSALPALSALVLFLAASPMPANAQYEVVPVSTQDANGPGGILYCLPQNSFRVELVVEKTTWERGLYSDYAEQLLKLPAIRENSVSYQIKEIRLHQRALPDPSQTFRVEGTRLPALELSPEGILLGVNPPEPLPGPLPGHPAPALPQPVPEKGPRKGKPERPRPVSSRTGSFAPVAGLNASKRFDTLVTRRRLDSLTIVEKILQPRIDQKSLFDQAREVAGQILKIRNDQSDLLSGLQEVAYPQGTIQFMYRQLQKNEKQLLECFTGTCIQEEIRYSFDITPERGRAAYPIAFFSPEEGIERIPSGQEEALDSGNDVLLLLLEPLPRMDTENEPAPASPRKGSAPKETPAGGFCYRVPAKVKARIGLNGEILEEKDLFVAQWGSTVKLPVLEGYRMELHKESGALLYLGKPQASFPPQEAPSPGNKPRRQ